MYIAATSVKKALLGPFLLALTANLSFASDLGTTGIIDIPTARMMDDGGLRTTISKQDTVSIYSINYQATPWLETTFRYAGWEDFFHYDRSYEAKFRLLKETDYMPQVSVGIRDLMGTGVFGAEYIVGSKKLGPLDLTAGVGWGRLAGEGDFKNPLASLSDNFNARNAETGLGGEVSFDNFFSGPKAAIFGGVTYQLPEKPVKFLLEYNPDKYLFETRRGQEKPASPLSVGLEWEISDGLFLATSYQHNEEFGLRISANLNSKAPSKKFAIKPFKSSLDGDGDHIPSSINLSAWYDRLLFDMEKSGLYLYEADYSNASDVVTLEIGNKKFHHWPDAISVALRLANLHLPKRFKSIVIILNENGHQVHSIRTPRPYSLGRENQQSFINLTDILPPRKISNPRNSTGFAQLKIPVNVSLQNRVQIMDPDRPLRYQIFARFGANLLLSKNLSLVSNYALNIRNDFDTIKRESNSVLPRVRSETKKYLQEGESGIENLYLSYKNSLNKNVHYRFEAGILEEMFSGIGGEVLYAPSYSTVAFGLSAHHAKKRDYDRGFNHLNYEVLTGFASAYWASPFYNFDVGLHAGRYLARDKGATLELTRTFDNGWRVGAWASSTNVSAEDFGEGSFDKGLYFKVPLHVIFDRDSRSSFRTNLRSIQRDGGARLDGFSGSLWHSLRDVRYELLENNKERMKP